MSEQPQSQRHRPEQDEPFHPEPTTPVAEHVIDPSSIVPDEYGNTYVAFEGIGSGLGAVHTVRGWIIVREADES